jgi:hypothetical protein
MDHEFDNGLAYKITVICTSTMVGKNLITFDLNPNEKFTWNQNEGTSFNMEVKDNNGNVILENYKYTSPTVLKFRLLAGQPQVVLS